MKKRVEIIFHFDENYLSELYYGSKQVRGGKKEYSDKMYEYLPTIKVMFRLPWRATIGFAEGLLKKAFPRMGICVPNYAHARRESMRSKIESFMFRFKRTFICTKKQRVVE